MYTFFTLALLYYIDYVFYIAANFFLFIMYVVLGFSKV